MKGGGNELRSELGRVRGLGSAKEGVEHWWAQRLTAVALIPLSFLFVIFLIALSGSDYATVAHWVGHPIAAILLTLLVIASYHHSQLGLQVVCEDYLHPEWVRLVFVVIIKAGTIVLGAASIFAIFHLAFVG